MAVDSLGQLTVDLVANTGGFEKGMDRAQRSLKSATKEAAYQANQLDKLVGQIDPVVAAYGKLDKMEEQLRQHRAAGRLDEDDFSGYLKKLNDQREAIGKVDTITQKAGMSAKAYAAALRGVPAQFTDIVTSLQAGQSPMTVLLQQGGQLKDQFGGIGPAAKALGGYVAGLVNPFTVAAAAAAVLAVAYKQGSDEAVAYRAALITTGNAAGTNADQLGSMAQSVSKSVGTVGAAAAVLAQLAASGKIPAGQFDMIAVAALKMQDATGQAADETIKQFEKLAEDPVKASKELNDQLNYLTASEFAQIDALQRRGDAQGAATMAENAYASALSDRADKIKSSLGIIESAWDSVKNKAKEAWDAALNIGREDTTEQRLKVLQDRLQAIADADAINQTKGSGGQLVPQDTYRQTDTEAQIRDLLVQQEEVRKRLAAQQNAAAREKAGIAAVGELNKALDDSADKADKLKKRYAEIDKQVSAAAKTGVKYSDAQIAQLRKAAEDQYTDKPKAQKAYQEDAGTKMLDSLRQQNAALQAQEALIGSQGQKSQLLGQQAQELAKWEQQIADIKEKKTLTADQKALLSSSDLITAQLKKNVALEQEVTLRKRAAEEAQKLAAFQDNLSSQLATAQRGLDANVAGSGLGDQEKQRLQEQLRLQQQYQAQQDRLEAQHNKGEISDSLYSSETQALQNALDQRLAMQQNYYAQVDKDQADWTKGATSALANYMDTASNVAAQTKSLFADALSGTEDAIVKFVKTGKLSFSDLADSIVEDLIRIEVRQAAVGLLGSVAGLLGGGGSSSLLGSGTMTGYSNSLSLVANAKGGVYDSPSLSSYSNQVYDRPQTFAFAKGAGIFAEAGPEAIMPLTRAADGSLGVRALGTNYESVAKAAESTGTTTSIGGVTQHITIGGNADAATVQQVQAAAKQGALDGYNLVLRDLKQNGPARQLIAKR